MKCYLATIQVLISGMESESQACDWFAETLRESPNVHDWGYLRDSRGEYPLPRPVEIDEKTYNEGDLSDL